MGAGRRRARSRSILKGRQKTGSIYGRKRQQEQQERTFQHCRRTGSHGGRGKQPAKKAHCSFGKVGQVLLEETQNGSDVSHILQYTKRQKESKARQKRHSPNESSDKHVLII